MLLRLHRDTLFRNSFYLMLGTAVMAGFGFFFWLINARLFTAADIGVATTLISVMGLIALLSLIGFSSAFVRFLPKAEDRNSQINTGLILSSAAATLFSALFIAFVGMISPQLAFIQHHFWFALLFIIACVMNTLNVLTDSIFLAGRKTIFTLVINTIFSGIKMLAPFAFVGWGAIGIFTAAALAQTFGTALSIAAMMHWFEYRPAFVIDTTFVTRIWRYSAANYFSSILNLLPATLLPIIVINNFGPESAAYFYISMMIANLLYAIPYATTRSLFAEGSHDEASFEENFKKSVRIIALLLLPSILVLYLGSGLILEIFGKAYHSGGVVFLRLVSVAGITVSAYSLSGAIFLVRKNSRGIMLLNLTYSVSVIGLSYLLLPLGLPGIGIAWVGGNAIAAIIGFSSDAHNRAYFVTKLNDVYRDVRELVSAKTSFVHAWMRNGFKRKVVLFYPERPRIWHVMYPACHALGISISNNPQKPFDHAVAFWDTTVRPHNAVLEQLVADQRVINARCGDISKQHVESVFTEVFGYGTSIDPRSHTGAYVQKSDSNATHDGKILNVPSEPEPGYVYQKLINNECEDGMVVELRVPIVNNSIPLVLRRYKSNTERFNHTLRAEVVTPDTEFSEKELHDLLRFAQAFGLQYGELDVLRDRDTNKIYVVDANNTPGHPNRGVQMQKKEYDTWLSAMADSFDSHLFT
jgi:O-antigen/teichoic acid export membrane protein